MEVRYTFPECCITCQHREVFENESTCVYNAEVNLKNKINQVLTVCSEYDRSWNIENTYRNKLGLPSLPTNYDPYGLLGEQAREKLKEAFEAHNEPLSLKEQLEIFIGSQRSKTDD